MTYRFQFSLKWLLVATTAAAIIVAAVRWHANRLPVLVDAFNALVHQHRYTEAEAVADRARRLYPNELITEQLEFVCRLYFHNERLPEPEPRWSADELAGWQKLVDEHRAAKVRSSGTQE